MRAKGTRRKHEANAQVKIFGLSKAGTSIDLELFANEEKLGTLVIGRGSFTWFGAKRKHGRRYSWSRFAEIMESLS
jgi:hypothetical protein